MWPESTIWGYIDPNTSQHVFSLVGPVVTLLAAAGGLVVTGFVVVRHRIASYFQKASAAQKITTASLAIGALAVISVVIYELMG